MTTYNAIAGTRTDPNAPIDSSLMKDATGNPLALIEADDTAPVTAGNWHPYNKVTNGDTVLGQFYNFASNGAQTSIVTPDFADGWEYRIRIYNLSIASSSSGLSIELFRETTGSYSASYQMGAVASSITDVDFEIMLPWVRFSKRDQEISFQRTINAASNAWAAPADQTTQILQMSTAQKITRARLTLGVATDGGVMRLDRRRLIV
jgi:hypothetical protein